MSRSSAALALRVFHVDDDEFERSTVLDALTKASCSSHRFEARGAESMAAFWQAAQAEPPDVVLMDINLSSDPQEGLVVVPDLRRRFPEAVIIMRSSSDDARTVQMAISLGADDFLSKRVGDAELGFRVAAAHQLASLKRGAVPQSVVAGAGARKAPKAVGETIGRLAKQMPRLVSSAVSALHVVGESGTGKELVADLVETELKGQSLLRVNCGALSPTLLESELFGHVKGAFTGAVADKAGLIESASGGWLFLDEVATLSPSAQVALLRVLENGEVTRVGESTPRKVRVRVISACNEPLDKLVVEGKFRRDLWQRLREVELRLPPLRERPHEIPGLVAHFCATMEGGPYSVTPEAMEVLAALPWQHGNIRELRNCLRAMTAMHVNKVLGIPSLPAHVADQSPLASLSAGDAGGVMAGRDSPLHGLHIVLPARVSPTESVCFDALVENLFAQLVTQILEAHPEGMSLRALARCLEMSPTEAQTRLQELQARGGMQGALFARVRP